jgi:acetyl esterase/lipase
MILEILTDLFSDVTPDPAIRRQDQVVPGVGNNPSVRLRSYRPLDLAGPLPCLYWIHGGAHVLGSIDQDDLLSEQYVRAAGGRAPPLRWRSCSPHPFAHLLLDAGWRPRSQ